MNKNNGGKILFISCIVMAILFNLIIFLVPNEVMGVTRFDKPVFWVSYVFIMICLIIQGIIDFKFSKIKEVGEKMFLNIPLIRTGYIAIIVSIIIGLVFMIVPVLPDWVGAIVCVLLTAFLIVSVIKANTAATAIEEVGKKVAKQTYNMKMAVADASIICDMADEEKKNDANRLYESLRYSDYVTCDEVANLDAMINENLVAAKSMVNNGTAEEFSSLVDKTILIVNERNTKVKMFKK